eukprot:gi/632978696/ref/XP_007906059.1/ PREDICTED: telomere repeats-binding bouquet formation protein 1 isoform X2 [Callorhinchus milii]
MENSESGSIFCGLKTDLNLLLECLKYQMDSPLGQKQALVTIYSICQQNNSASDYFREIGGLQFVNGLVKLSNDSTVQEAALFTLGGLAESSVYCQQTLCTTELLSYFASSLAQKEASLNLKRIAVYVILVLVSHNKFGQGLARTTGCIDILLILFSSFPISNKHSIHQNISQCYELWSSIGSTLCACVNNPQNEENQRICTTVFLFARDCLQKYPRQEIIRPICSFVGLTVANNTYAQDCFSNVGGLDTLAEVLVKLIDEAGRNCSTAKLAVILTKTLDSCIAENSSVASRLTEYSIVPKLLMLLSQGNHDFSGKLGIILAIGHCTDSCEDHQYQLLQNNGLPLMIQIVAESQDEEQRKAATFVLQSCQRITERLSDNLIEHSQPRDTLAPCDINYPKNSCLKGYWKFAQEFLSRMKTLENQQEELATNRFMNTRDTEVQKMAAKSSPSVNEELQAYHSVYPGLQQTDNQRKGQAVKHYGETHILDKPCMDSGKIDKLPQPGNTEWKRTIYNCTPIKRNLDYRYAVDGQSKEGSVIRSVGLSHSRDEDRNQCRDRQLVERVRRQIFVEDDVALESIRETTAAAQSRMGGFDRANCIPRTRDASSQWQYGVPIGPHGGSVGSRESTGYLHRNGTSKARGSSGSAQFVASGKERKCSKEHTHDKGYCTSCKERDLFKKPASIMRKRRQHNCIDPLILCSDLINSEAHGNSSPALSNSVETVFRCTGCVKAAPSLNSRSFSRILHLCPYKCDRHKVIQDAEDRYKKSLKKLMSYNKNTAATYRRIVLTPVKECTSRGTDFSSRQILNPLKAAGKHSYTNGQQYQPEPRKELCMSQCKAKVDDQDHTYSFDDDDEHSDTCRYYFKLKERRKKRKRKDFTPEEVTFLIEGVKLMGKHWNSILWSFPFQESRTNVDLAQKYRNLQGKKSDSQQMVRH